jgi:hypothetical protein
MHPEVAELAALADEVAELLTGCGEMSWGEWFRKDARRIRNLDLYGVEHLKLAYGGMGSVNDLVLHPRNGHTLRDDEIGPANERLRSLLSKVSWLAKKLYAEEISAQHANK